MAIRPNCDDIQNEKKREENDLPENPPRGIYLYSYSTFPQRVAFSAWLKRHDAQYSPC